jgi:hypothetical protein
MKKNRVRVKVRRSYAIGTHKNPYGRGFERPKDDINQRGQMVSGTGKPKGE